MAVDTDFIETKLAKRGKVSPKKKSNSPKFRREKF